MPVNGMIKTYSNANRTFSRPYSAKMVFFYKDGDEYFTGLRVPISKVRYRTMDALLDRLNESIALPYGVRRLHTPYGRTPIQSIDQLEHLGKYVASSSGNARGVDLTALERRRQQRHQSQKRATALMLKRQASGSSMGAASGYNSALVPYYRNRRGPGGRSEDADGTRTTITSATKRASYNRKMSADRGDERREMTTDEPPLPSQRSAAPFRPKITTHSYLPMARQMFFVLNGHPSQIHRSVLNPQKLTDLNPLLEEISDGLGTAIFKLYSYEGERIANVEQLMALKEARVLAVPRNQRPILHVAGEDAFPQLPPINSWLSSGGSERRARHSSHGKKRAEIISLTAHPLRPNVSADGSARRDATATATRRATVALPFHSMRQNYSGGAVVVLSQTADTAVASTAMVRGKSGRLSAADRSGNASEPSTTSNTNTNTVDSDSGRPRSVVDFDSSTTNGVVPLLGNNNNNNNNNNNTPPRAGSGGLAAVFGRLPSPRPPTPGVLMSSPLRVSVSKEEEENDGDDYPEQAEMQRLYFQREAAAAVTSIDDDDAEFERMEAELRDGTASLNAVEEEHAANGSGGVFAEDDGHDAIISTADDAELRLARLRTIEEENHSLLSTSVDHQDDVRNPSTDDYHADAVDLTSEDPFASDDVNHLQQQLDVDAENRPSRTSLNNLVNELNEETSDYIPKVVAASVMIQKHWRGYQIRKLVKDLKFREMVEIIDDLESAAETPDNGDEKRRADDVKEADNGDSAADEEARCETAANNNGDDDDVPAEGEAKLMEALNGDPTQANDDTSMMKPIMNNITDDRVPSSSLNNPAMETSDGVIGSAAETETLVVEGSCGGDATQSEDPTYDIPAEEHGGNGGGGGMDIYEVRHDNETDAGGAGVDGPMDDHHLEDESRGENMADTPVSFASDIQSGETHGVEAIRPPDADILMDSAFTPAASAKATADSRASKASNKFFTYIVTVKTGNRWAADTEADLYLIMHGDAEKTEKLILRQESSEPKFRQNQLDSFRVEVPAKLGVLRRITVGHEHFGYGAGVFIERILITEDAENNEHEAATSSAVKAVGAMADGVSQAAFDYDGGPRQFLFLCNKWFDSGQVDGKLERHFRLSAFHYVNSAPTFCGRRTKGRWEFVFHSGTVSGEGGTTSNLKIVGYGTNGQSTTSNIYDSRMDKVPSESLIQIDFGNIGDLLKVRVEIDGYGPQPDYFLNFVLMRDLDTQERFVVMCGKWLRWQNVELGAQSFRELFAFHLGIEPLPLIAYEGRLHLMPAKIDCFRPVIDVEFHGDLGESGLFSVAITSFVNAQREENGLLKRTDQLIEIPFKVEAVSIGRVYGARVFFQPTEFGAQLFEGFYALQQMFENQLMDFESGTSDWLIRGVILRESPHTPYRYLFTQRRLRPHDEFDAVLEEAENHQPSADPPQAYAMDFINSEMEGVVTRSAASRRKASMHKTSMESNWVLSMLVGPHSTLLPKVTLCNNRGQSAEMQVLDPTPADGIISYQLKTSKIDALRKIRVSADSQRRLTNHVSNGDGGGGGKQTDIFDPSMDYVGIRKIRVCDTINGDELRFPNADIELGLNSVYEFSAIWPDHPPFPIIIYGIRIVTSASTVTRTTDFTVRLNLLGEYGDVGSRCLFANNEMSPAANLFQQNSQNAFEFEAVSIGAIRSAEIVVESSEKTFNWECKAMFVVDGSTSLTYVFKFLRRFSTRNTHQTSNAQPLNLSN